MAKSSTTTVLCLGDIVARPGKAFLRKKLKALRETYGASLVVVNGENAAGGIGLDKESANTIFHAGADVITLGDHAWNKRGVETLLEEQSARIIRPANYPEAPGKGYTVFKTSSGVKVGVMNLIGRVFMNFSLDCPFKEADRILAGPLKNCALIVCDMHAEATSEKVAMGHYLDARVSMVYGTHSHVQTADEQILPGGTAYITDLGMCGCSEGVIGMDSDVALFRMTSGRPRSYKAAKGRVMLNGIVATFDNNNGRALSIERIRLEGMV
ncbi:MAG: YmdB family metallophosphoesterase [Candidatus Dadabacteria bacterium]|nr:MAG: YmdB family metallophosphoesterase [Candidatus Dadabacteria bacterium]